MHQPYRRELSVDLYELTMSQVFWRRGLDSAATFSLFFRGYPKNRGYYIACGIEDALDFLSEFRFSDREIAAIRSTASLDDDFVNYLSNIRFNGDVRAVREGSIVFADEPLIEVTGNLIEAQIVETMLLNIVTTASLLATKAARVVEAAAGRPVIDFGSRRTHGEDAALAAARYGYLAGFAGTSNLKAAAMYGVPAYGTMAHSFIQAFNEEASAFSAYLNEFPDATTLLVDTYDTLSGVEKAIQVAQTGKTLGHSVSAVRLDSGTLGRLAESTRSLLDAAGLHDVRILVSGGLDEYSIRDLVESGAPIDAFGIGTRFGTSADAPYIDSVYKLVEIDGRPVYKLSLAKSTLPWAKQVFRRFDSGYMFEDLLARADSPMPDGYSTTMLSQAMESGKRISPRDDVQTIQERISSNLNSLSHKYLRLCGPERYPVHYAYDANTVRS